MKNKQSVDIEELKPLRQEAGRGRTPAAACRELPSFVERLVGRRLARRLPAEGRVVHRWD